MTNHPLKRRPTSQELMERKRKAKQERKPPATNRYLAQKATGLKYDYNTIDPAHREQVQRAALEIHRWQRDTIALGQTLLAVKDALPHRQFLEWLKVEFDMGERSIQSMMNVARVYGEPEKAQRVALLSTGALYELAAPSTPPEARAAIEEQLDAGQIPTRAEVKRVIDEYKPPSIIEGEYTVTPKEEFIFPAPAIDTDHCAPIIHRDLARKLQDAMVHRIFRVVLNNSERDELLIALTRALEE